MRKKVNSRIVISTNEVTHILLSRALHAHGSRNILCHDFLQHYISYKIDASAKSIYGRQSEEEFLLLAISSQNRAHFSRCFISQLCRAGTREILMLKKVLTLKFFPFTCLLSKYLQHFIVTC